MAAHFSAPVLKPRLYERGMSDGLKPEGYVDPDREFVAILNAPSGPVELGPWVSEYRAALETLMAKAGGILLRGFSLNTPHPFGAGVRAFGRDQLPYLERAAVRSEVAPGVFTSTEFSSDHFIDLHHEMSFARDLPERIFFFAETLAETGGATPLADEWAATAKFDAAILKVFEERGVIYERNFRPEIDMDWRSAFQTQDRADVAAYCEANGTQFEWLGPEHLRTRQRQKAFARVPATGDKLFCNHAHLFHTATLPPGVLASLIEEFGTENLPRRVFFGDGSPIPDAMIHDIRAVYAEETRTFDWQRHDVLALDNLICLHGRAPFTGKRTTLVSMTTLVSRGV